MKAGRAEDVTKAIGIYITFTFVSFLHKCKTRGRMNIHCLLDNALQAVTTVSGGTGGNRVEPTAPYTALCLITDWANIKLQFISEIRTESSKALHPQLMSQMSFIPNPHELTLM